MPYVHSHREKPFLCAICSKTFSHKNYYNRHVRVHTGDIKFNETGFKTFSESNLIYNKPHDDEKLLSCTVCQQKFLTRCSLDLHNVQVHGGMKLYPCVECNKKFTSMQNVRTHMIVHTGQKPYTCFSCNKSFWFKNNLKKHLEIHTRGRKRKGRNKNGSGKKSIYVTHATRNFRRKAITIHICASTLVRNHLLARSAIRGFRRN